MEDKITYISVDKLHPHPDNPRKEIGDVTQVEGDGVVQIINNIPRRSDDED